MEIIEPVTAEDFRHYFELRWKILRAPWKQPRGSERDSQDNNCTHLMIMDDKQRTLGVGRLHFINIREAQIRYMAIEIANQRRGYGARLLHALEAKARKLGANRVTLDARETALRFYHKHGYTACGPGPVLFNSIAHVKMEKEL